MSQSTWQWQSKVNRMQKILHENDIDCTFNVSTSSGSDANTTQSAIDGSIGFDSSVSSSSASERLMDMVNYSDFEAGELRGMSTNLKFPERIGNFGASKKPSNTVAKIDDVTSINLKAKNQNDVCSASDTKFIVSESRPENSKDITNWIPLLELIKSSVVKVIDEHIELIRNKAVATQKQQDRRIERMKKNLARKTIERRDCIQRIRTELTDKMDNLKDLLDALEKI